MRQCLYTFRAVLKDANLGELFVGIYRPEGIDYLFLSIQTFTLQDFTATLERMDAKSVLSYFNNYGIFSVFLTGKSSDEGRKTTKGTW